MSTTVTLTLHLTGSASGPAEAARILRRTADHLEHCDTGLPGGSTLLPLYDINGNRAGTMEAQL
jgi:hypothetical protein